MFRTCRFALAFLLPIFSTPIFNATASSPLFAQQSAATAAPDPCAMPLLTQIRNDQNLFNEQQEEWLGELMDQDVQKDFHVIEDADGYLQRLGERLLAQLPPTKIHYRFLIIDSPELNSFSLAGGRVYIFRRMIAFAKNEDELASLVAHEIGHLSTHQSANDLSGYFRQLGIKGVGDRQDIFAKWNQFKDNARKIKHGSDDQRDQLIADRVGLYAMTRAGYDPAQFTAFIDRLLETKGKTGSFWSDFFGATSPESKRLRGIMRNASPLPPGCVSSRPAATAFSQWQQAVIQAKAEVAKEELPGLVRKVALNPPLRNELSYLQFSPDGKYLAAQDDASIFLLSRQPLANLFRIDAPGANRVQFTPDSSSVVFNDQELRVQKWEIASHRQVSIRELSSQCLQSALSPTGEALACFRPDGELQLVDVASGEPFFSKKSFVQWSIFDQILLDGLVEIPGLHGLFLISMQAHFSPDGRYLIAAHRNSSLGYDLKARSEIKLAGRIRELTQANFVFTSSDELFGVSREFPRKMLRLRFPDGAVIDQFPYVGNGEPFPVVKANYVLMAPLGRNPIGLIDLGAKKSAFGYKTLGFAVCEDIFAGDDIEGNLSLYRQSDKSEFARIKLPDSPLSYAQASAFSPNGKLLAVSGRTRASMWALENGSRIGYSAEFNGAYFDQDKLIVRFMKHEKGPGQVLSITPSPLAVTKLYELEPASETNEAKQAPDTAFLSRSAPWQEGDLLIHLETTDPKKPGNRTLNLHDIRTNLSLWQLPLERYSPQIYYMQPAGTITLVTRNFDKIKEVAKHDAALSAKLDAIGNKQEKQSTYMLQAFGVRSQKALGNILVDTGNLSFRVQNARTAGDSVFVSDSLGRTLVYSLKSGEQRGKVTGRAVAISTDGTTFVVENADGNVDLYDSNSLQSLRHFTFPSRIAHAEFTEPENLMILTSDQTVYQLNTARSIQNAEKH